MIGLVLVLVLILAGAADAFIVGKTVPAPSITSVSGTLTHGSTLTITGTSLGTKGTAAPALFDNFEDDAAYSGLSDDDALPTGTLNPGGATEPWYSDSTAAVATYESGDAQRGANGTAFVRHTGNAWLAEPDALGGDAPTPASRRELYVAWWVRFDADLDTAAASHKVIRVWDDPAGDAQRISWTEQHMTYGNKGLANLPSWVNTHPLENAWHLMEIWVDEDASRIRAWMDGKLLHDVLQADFRYLFLDETITDGPDVPSGTQKTNGLTVAQVGLNPSGGDHASTVNHLDDIYVDDTPARVVLSDQAVWNDAVERHLELQIPTAWSDTEIQVTLNQGSFGTLDSTLYIYVINYKGRVSNGMALPVVAGAFRSDGRGY